MNRHSHKSPLQLPDDFQMSPNSLGKALLKGR